MLTVLLAFLAIVLNSGHALSVKSELHNAADSAALAGAHELNGASSGLTAARAAAVDYAALHVTDAADAVTLDPSADVRLGRWDFSTAACNHYDAPSSCFQELSGTAAELPLMNAVSVATRRDVPVWLSTFLGGTAKLTPAVEVVAVGGGPRYEGCPPPIVVPSCAVSVGAFLDCCKSAEAAGGSLAACTSNVQFTTKWSLANATADTIGLTTFTPSPPNHADINALLNTACSARAGVSIGSTVGLQNGNDFTKADVNDFNKQYANKPGMPIAIIQSAGCPNPSFNQTETVVGFATATFSTATWINGSVGGKGGSTGNGFSFDATLTCVRSTQPAGGGFFGTLVPPTLVK
jgi:hypothetical protein